MEFKMKEFGFQTTTDYGELHVAGDETFGHRPYQLMVASIAVCSGGLLRQILSKKRIEFKNITIRTEVKRNEAEANRIEKIRIHYIIDGKNLDPEKIEKSIALANKNCPMAQSVNQSIIIQETFELNT